MVRGLNAGNVDRSVEREGVIGVDVQLIGVLEHDAQRNLIDHFVADRGRTNRQRVGRHSTEPQKHVYKLRTDNQE